MSDCVFCKIVDGKIPSQKIYEDENILGFKDVHPMRDVHYLFIPKKHIVSLADFEPKETEVVGEIFSAIFATTRKEGMDQKGYRTVINTGVGGGQEVLHLHVHVLSGNKLRSGAW